MKKEKVIQAALDYFEVINDTIKEHETCMGEELIKIDPVPEMVLENPLNHEKELKDTILERMRLLMALEIPFERPSPDILEWLDAD